MMLTGYQAGLLHRADRTGGDGGLTDKERAALPGFHFCPDWDFLPICEGSAEWDACTCEIRWAPWNTATREAPTDD